MILMTIAISLAIDPGVCVQITVSFRCEIGGIGQPMSLLLKQNPGVTALSLYDIRGAPGVAADISHVNTHSTVKGFEKDE